MTIEQAEQALKRLQAYYPTMAKMDEASVTAYMQEIQDIKWEDFCAGAKIVVRTSKFFPSIAELMSAADDACRKRIAKQDHDEREERLALQAGEDKIFDPKSEIHRDPIGPNHAIFLEYLNGTRTFPDPEWMTRKRAKP